MKTLVTGNAGSGKSSIATELKHKGYNAFDADEGFGHWIHKSSGETRTSRPASNRGDYYWVWDITKIGHLLEKAKDDTIFFCGLATNQAQLYNDFDKIVVLNCDLKAIGQRLKNRHNNPFGKRPGDLDWVRKTQVSFRLQLPKTKVVEVDATQPLEKVVDEILGHVNEA